MVRPSLFFHKQAQILLLPFPQCLCSLYSCFWGKIEGKHKRLGSSVAVPGWLCASGKRHFYSSGEAVSKESEDARPGPCLAHKEFRRNDILCVWRQQVLPHK